jgi:hypothetical protein
MGREGRVVTTGVGTGAAVITPYYYYYYFILVCLYSFQLYFCCAGFKIGTCAASACTLINIY